MIYLPSALSISRTTFSLHIKYSGLSSDTSIKIRSILKILDKTSKIYSKFIWNTFQIYHYLFRNLKRKKNTGCLWYVFISLLHVSMTFSTTSSDPKQCNLPVSISQKSNSNDVIVIITLPPYDFHASSKHFSLYIYKSHRK